ncbi:hypothetical protein [Pleomorphomonas koreensis]|uniref:hypothetical protein n=1 Tax=Pleomorphomonas koreensis TaxID=257440 RepID=UPI0012EC165A|nr:hypothetical protein [Pleomorphomonas koreensis]
MEFLSAIYLYSTISGALVALYFGIHLFILNLFILFGLCLTFCGAGSYGFLNSILFTFVVLISNQASFACGIVYKYFHILVPGRIADKNRKSPAA